MQDTRDSARAVGHRTEHFQSAQLLASLGFADIGATNSEIAVEVVRTGTCTHARIPNCGPFWEPSPAPPLPPRASNTPGMTLAAARGPT